MDNKLVLCIPVYDDWESVKKLIHRVELLVGQIFYSIDILLIDDGSRIEPFKQLESSSKLVENVRILRLRRNLGHQRAIAIGLSYIHARLPCSAVVVMDGDGEDAPEDIPKLLDKFESCQKKKLVFAKRGRRPETVLFKMFYILYKTIHRILTGRGVYVGNYSVVPFDSLDNIVGISEVWSHYAASVYKANLPVDMIEIDRRRRIAGQSRMNFTSLVIHGLSAFSVYSEIIGTRILMFLSASTLSLMAIVGIILYLKLLTTVAIPDWATLVVGILVVLISQAIVIVLIFVLGALVWRSANTFLPVRDYHYYILDSYEVVKGGQGP